jgi:hypothetical protein
MAHLARHNYILFQSSPLTRGQGRKGRKIIHSPVPRVPKSFETLLWVGGQT